MKRRQLLKVGLLGAAALGAVAWWAVPRDRGLASSASSAPSAFRWDADRDALIGAIAQALLGPAADGSPAHRQRAVAGVRQAISTLSPTAQGEVDELLSLLTFAPARMALTGVWAPWAQAAPEAVGAFLEKWRHSRIGLLQSGYHALHDLVLGSWYADPQTWAAIGYPGPPTIGGSAS